MTTDPFTVAQRALEEWLRDSPGVKKAVRGVAPKIVAFNKMRGTEGPDVASEHDLPQIRLEPIGGVSNLNFSSHTVEITWNLRVVIATGDQRVNHLVFPVLFAVYAALAAALDKTTGERLLSTKWNDKEFIRNLSLESSEVGQSDPSANKGIEGWMAVPDVTLHLYFTRADLVSFHNGEL